MAAKIETVSSRSKLKPRREPYWQRLKRGAFVGFRKMTADSIGTWIARVRSEGKQVFVTLGTFDDYPQHERFDLAVRAAGEWLQHKAGPSTDKSVRTVADACDLYVQHLKDTKGVKASADAEARYGRWIRPHRIAGIDLQALTREDCRAFRRDLAGTPVVKKKDGEKTERSKDSVNRDMTPLRAALNFAFAEGVVNSDFAWRETLKPFDNAGRRRELYLDRKQREKLIGESEPNLAKFLRGLAAVPLRPGAIAALPVQNFEPRLGTLKVGQDKHGQDRKLTLGPRVAQLFCAACHGKKPEEPIFTRADGTAWNKDAWKHPIKDAAAAAGLPATTTAYTLRHSIITDLVHDGLDLLTVAQISGTSVAMIERHYGHFRGNVAAAALERVAILPCS
jgi:site-specific recombinase XerD